MESPTSPPPGWYEEADRPGRLRWWDGSGWTDKYQTVAAIAEVEATPPATATATPHSSVVCPRCASADALKRVGTLIDEGTSLTSGTAHTTTHTTGGVAIGYGGGMEAGTASGAVHQRSRSKTHINTRTMSQTARMLLWPDPPAFGFKTWFVRWYLGLAAVVGTLALSNVDGESLAERAFIAYVTTLVLIWIPALIIVFIQMMVTAPGRARATAAWEQGRRRLIDAYFCTRDGVVVDDGQAFGADAYKAMVFGR